jgi:hypothetical protein
MTTEACTTKLAYLLGRGIRDLFQIEQLLLKPLRGEISSADSLGKKFFNPDDDVVPGKLHSRL